MTDKTEPTQPAEPVENSEPTPQEVPDPEPPHENVEPWDPERAAAQVDEDTQPAATEPPDA